MTAAARVVFALLVVATFGAFFAAQRLKHTPHDIQQIKGSRMFSPNGDGWHDVMSLSFLVKRSDDVTVEMVDHRGDPVRTLLRDRPTRAYRKLPAMVWDGRTDAGTRAPDGIYRARVTLRREGRSILIPRAVTLDTTPPRPRVASIGPSSKPGPELLPNRTGRVDVHLSAPAGAFGQVLIFKTAPGRPRLVTRYPLERGKRTTAWSGRAHGHRVSAGTYLVVVRWRDKAGNLGASTPLEKGLPALPYGEALPGRGGVTVRYLEVAPPSAPSAPGELTAFGVDARGACYRWSIRRVGAARSSRRGRSCHGLFNVHAPGKRSGVYLFEARTARHVARVPFAVQAASPAPILVVLPLMTWQGRNPVDDDGDGAPDLLDRGVAVRTSRVLALGRLPHGFATAEGPLLAFLARHGRRFDVTTDLALARGSGPRLADHRGVVLAGDVRWLPQGTALALRRFVSGGGTLLDLGLDSLRRGVTLTPHLRLSRPTAPAATDVFGARLAPIVRRPVSLTNARDDIRLFAGDVLGGTGVFAGFPGYQATEGLGPRERLVASAVNDADADQRVIVAARFGRGLVIRTGLLRFADRLSSDANSAQLVLRAWALLAGRR